MQIFGFTVEGHGHNKLAQSGPVKQDQTGRILPVDSNVPYFLLYKIVRSGAKCIASLFCYILWDICKTHAVVV